MTLIHAAVGGGGSTELYERRKSLKTTGGEILGYFKNGELGEPHAVQERGLIHPSTLLDLLDS